MGNKENLINNLQKLFRDDEFIKALFDSAGKALDTLDVDISDQEKELWFDTLTLVGISLYEKQLNYKVDPAVSIEDQRSHVEARWKLGGKSDLELLQGLADTWENGAININFNTGTIEVEFVSIYGIPTDLDGLKDSLETAIPCHLPISYIFKYRTWGELKDKTWNELVTKTWGDIREGVI